ncbi:hypothetical protein BDZ94DRAFT_1263165 [Collybia nuda]|uniref:F-box domain-containing protein n=1 Tax=Collybia nuda TaxID=64659 RepID=A0A9P5Y1S6_9AGAR|nr:hypothetical protein BDZ94DRAFT_1263165 [Collybia nuda]
MRNDITLVNDDVLLELFNYLSNKDLYGLSILCRRLHHIALPLYLSRLDIKDPTSSINLTVEDFALDALSGLRIALFIPSSAHIICEIPQAQNFFRSLARMESFISRLLAVGHITFHLRGSIYNSSFSNDQIQRNKWNQRFKELRQVLAAKACSRLELVDMDAGSRMIFTPTVNPVVPRHRGVGGVIGRVINIGRGLHQQTWNEPEMSSLPGIARSKAKWTPLPMTSIHIRSPSTLYFLRQQQKFSTFSSLQSLTFHCSLTSKTEWAEILMRIVLFAPMLSSVTILTPHMDTRDVISFSGSLPHLTHLTIFPVSYEVFSDKYLVTPRFPSLTNLSSSPQYINTFLSFESPLPKIQFIEIGLTCLPKPNLDTIFDQMNRVIKRLSEMRSNVSLSLKIHAGDECVVKDYMTHYLDRSLAGFDVKTQLTFVETLTIVDLPVLHSKFDAELCTIVFPRWLSLFGQLRHVNLTGYASDSHETIIQTVRTSCLQCLTMNINDKLYPVRPQAETGNETSMALATSPGFFDIPDDVLYIVFNYLGLSELLALAALSRRLQLLSIPIYLTRRNILDPTTLARLPLGRDPHTSLADISALRLSLSVSTIRHLHCPIISYSGLFLVFEYFKQLRLLVLSLRSVEKVTIKFPDDQDHKMNYKTVREKWGELFGSFLDAVVKRRCVSLKLLGGALIEDNYRASQPMLLALCSPPSSIETKLTTLVTDSDTLLQTPILLQTVSILKHSRIIQLDLTLLSEDASHLLLNATQLLSMVTKLSIDGPSVRPALVMAFINGLPCLKYLNMRGSLSKNCTGSYFYPGFNPMLNLISLSAPRPFIMLLLDNPTFLPKLQSLTIVLTSSDFPVAILSQVAKHLRELDHPFTVSMVIPFFSISIINKGIDALLAENARWESPSTILINLKLSRNLNQLPIAEWSVPPSRWLSLFPNLLHLTIEERLPDHVLAAACSSFATACPSLVTFHANGANQPLRN